MDKQDIMNLKPFVKLRLSQETTHKETETIHAQVQTRRSARQVIRQFKIANSKKSLDSECLNNASKDEKYTLSPNGVKRKRVPKEQPKDDDNRVKIESSELTSDEDKSVGHGALSAYELERLENIRRNQSFLSSIKLPEATEGLKHIRQPKPSQKSLKSKSKIFVGEILPSRKSLRLQKKGTDLFSMPLEPIAVALELVHTAKKPDGPISMMPVNIEEGSALPTEFLKICTEDFIEVKKVHMNMKAYQTALKRMHMPSNGVVKVVKNRIFSAAFHPCSSNLLMAAGDKLGHVGLWKLGGEWGDDGVLLFEPHTRPVGCMAFSRSSPANLLTSSYDGSLRSMDVEKAAFDDVYSIEDGIKNFDFLSHDCSTLVVGDWYGDVAIVDRRTPGNSYESLHTLDPKAVRSVSVHPVQKQYFVVAESKVVSIYDTRFLRETSSLAVSQLHGHSLSINSAYFSPVTGHRVLTCCYDNKIRIYDTEAMTTTAPLLTSIRHNMQTGRWLSKLVAVWDPKQEDCFLVGSMDRPRCAQVFHESGQLLHTFRDEELSTVVSVTAFHPNRNALLGGNASGRLHIFTD